LITNVFRKSVDKIQASLKPDNNNGALHANRCVFVGVWLNSS